MAHADDVAAHAANRSLDELAAKLATVDRADEDAARGRRMVDVITSGIAAPQNPDLISLRDLDLIQEKVAVASAHFDVAALPDMLIELENALDNVRLPLIRSPKEAGAIAEGVRKFRQRLSEAKAEIKTSQDQAEARIAAAEAAAAVAESKLADAAATVQANLTAELAPIQGALADLTKSIDTQKARLDTAITNYQTTFNDAEAKRATDFDERRKAFLDEHAQALEKQREAAQEAAAETARVADERLEQLRAHEASARRLVSRTGSGAVSGGFLSDADRQASDADRWRWIGVAAFVLLAGFGLLTTNLTDPLMMNLEWLAGRLLVAVPLLAIGSYALQQSGMHRRSEREARAKELDFNAIDPYIELIDEPARSELKAELARRAFFRETGPGGDVGDVNVVEKLLDILKAAVTRK